MVPSQENIRFAVHCFSQSVCLLLTSCLAASWKELKCLWRHAFDLSSAHEDKTDVLILVYLDLGSRHNSLLLMVVCEIILLLSTC